ncbi:hypothetical protein VTP01DRAFT_1535 [Rhizomucor pusillus]|uniref:uncharacterized protein n=1 Tax=Rhizomucor pusillus TaxID=4840 RepID=UPI0037437BD8
MVLRIVKKQESQLAKQKAGMSGQVAPCAGPRKKKNKSQFLSPDDASVAPRSTAKSVKSRGSTIGSNTTASGTKKTNSVVSTARKTTPAASPRSSLEASNKLAKTTSRASLVSNGRPRSPHTRSPPPPGAAPSARSSARPPSHSRNSSAASSIRKSPVAQMREEFDELKVKNNENLQLIEQQKAELEQLKKQLLQQQEQQQQVPPSPPPPLTPSISQMDLDVLQAQKDETVNMLHEKEKQLLEREKELRELRQKLEEEKNVPSIVVNSQEASKEAEQALAERERMLEEKERALEEQRQKWESQNNLEQVAAQLERLKLQVQKQLHEESLRRHEEALAEKEKLLTEQKEALDKLQEAHEEEIRKVKTGQSSSILALQKRHKEEMAALKKRLEEAETKLKNNPANMDDEIERILNEFEQAEHSHAVQIENLQQSHQSELSDLQQSHVTQIHNLKKAQDQTRKGWTSRYLPTEAVSWPAPQPLSILRKTNGLNSGRSAVDRIAAAAKSDDEPILLPLDNKKVQVYISTVSGNPVIKKKQEDMTMLLKAENIEYEIVDVAASEAALQHMKRCNNNGSSEGRAKEVPQIFVGGEYRGQFEDVQRSIDEGTLDTLLRPAAERVLTEEEKKALKQAAEKRENEAIPPPVRVLPPGPAPPLRKSGTVKAYRGPVDDDEALFKELEREMSKGKLSEASLADL